MTIENHNVQESEPEIETVFDYSETSEMWRVKYCCENIGWFKEKGYNLALPKSIEERVKRGEIGVAYRDLLEIEGRRVSDALDRGDMPDFTTFLNAKGNLMQKLEAAEKLRWS